MAVLLSKSLNNPMKTILFAFIATFALPLYAVVVIRFVKRLDPVPVWKQRTRVEWVDDEPNDGQPDFTLDDLDWSEEYE